MQPFRILLVEDDQDDIELLKEALQNNHILAEMDIFKDGSQVMTYLEMCNFFHDLIVLDLNLPKIGGKELLKQIKASRFKTIPVVILTTSSAKEDIEFCLQHGADKYLTKPSTIEGLRDMVENLVSLLTIKDQLG